MGEFLITLGMLLATFGIAKLAFSLTMHKN